MLQNVKLKFSLTRKPYSSLIFIFCCLYIIYLYFLCYDIYGLYFENILIDYIIYRLN